MPDSALVYAMVFLTLPWAGRCHCTSSMRGPALARRPNKTLEFYWPLKVKNSGILLRMTFATTVASSSSLQVALSIDGGGGGRLSSSSVTVSHSESPTICAGVLFNAARICLASLHLWSGPCLFVKMPKFPKYQPALPLAASLPLVLAWRPLHEDSVVEGGRSIRDCGMVSRFLCHARRQFSSPGPWVPRRL